MKQLFHITNTQTDPVMQVLALRVGEQHASFAVTGKNSNELAELAYCTAEEWNETELNDLFAAYPVLKNSFYEVLICYDHPQSIILPSVGSAKEEAAGILNASALPGHQQLIISETIPGWQLLNVFSVPRETRDWLDLKFPITRSWHHYSLDIKNMTPSATGTLQVDFRKNDFTVVVMSQNKFLLAQTFGYATPEDVIYYLLKTCRQFSLSQQDVLLQLSGLIDKQSALYKELYQYFIHPVFRESSWKMPEEYPAHFFTGLNDLAKCAS
ncbi:MAG: DUF3822 family protein [Chitinophagaceae bacterium]